MDSVSKREQRYAEAIASGLARLNDLPKWFQVPAWGKDLSPLGERAASAVMAVADDELETLHLIEAQAIEANRDALRGADAELAEARAKVEELRALIQTFLRQYDTACPDWWPDLDDLRDAAEATR